MNNVDIFNICLAKKLSGGGGGTYESKSVTPDFSNGDVTVSSDEGYDALTSVTIEKDADLIAENIKKDVNVFGIVGTLEGGGDSQLDALIDRSITHVEDSRVTTIGAYVFDSCSNMTSVDFPHVTTVGDSAFTGCSALSVDLAEVFPKLTTIGRFTFQNCTGLTEINFPNLTNGGYMGFSGCTNVTIVNMPNFLTGNNQIFSGCTSLEEVILPKTTNVGASAFSGCTVLKKIVCPKVMGYPQIGGLSALQFLDCSPAGAVGNNFNTCPNVDTLIFRREITGATTPPVTCSTDGQSMSVTQFRTDGTGGTLYVPQSMLSLYENDAGWSTVLGWNANNQILAIEGSPYENP